jgi:hypothetical protein
VNLLPYFATPHDTHHEAHLHHSCTTLHRADLRPLLGRLHSSRQHGHSRVDEGQSISLTHLHQELNRYANVYTIDKCNSIPDHRSTDAMVRRPLPRLAARKAKPRRLGRRNQLLPLGSSRPTRERQARMPPKPAHTFIPSQFI